MKLIIVSRALKVIVLVITITCIGLHADSLVHGTSEQLAIAGCLLAFLIIGIAQVFELYKDELMLPRMVEIFFMMNGGLYFLAVACLCVQYYDSLAIKTKKIQHEVLAKGILACLNSALYVIGTFVACLRPLDRVREPKKSTSPPPPAESAPTSTPSLPNSPPTTESNTKCFPF